ncbi:sensor kinase/phosphatase LuxQ [Seminavis robusta]|uniref:Sensor kinase/phosphatase LuxQ n=1 Tax=Seminavis robusta TaxID=568900 RepID=A0A9N8E3C6_9STRA|nr:sensor kinase/phosphatase LuxQ [Seminavis robusta]|eukprot:Sro460_g147610.1 sensor kinase/phosphatase LuxQ (830) ;mRNA; f:55083-57653
MMMRQPSQQTADATVDANNNNNGSSTPLENDNDVSHSVAGSNSSDTKRRRRRQASAVHCLRWMLGIVLLCSTVSIASLVYLLQSETEQNEFETQLESDATKLLSSVGRNFAMTLAAAELYMYRIMYQAALSDATWPMITIPGLAVQAAKLMSQTNSIYMTFYPLIATPEDRKTWENFTQHNDGWVEEALQVQAKDPNFHGPILDNYTKSYTVWRNEGPEPDNATGPFLPSWMGSPVIPYYYPYNWNALAYPAFGEGLTHCMHTKCAVVTPVANNADPNDPVAVAQARVTSDWGSLYLSQDDDSNEPFSDLYYPVLPALDDVVFADPHNNISALGTVAFSFYWRHSLKDILPSQSKGLILVVQNPCRGGQSFTYQINGAQPVFLGFGDLHEPKFDRYARSSPLATLIERNKGKYTGLPMNDNFCPFTITVYPSTFMAKDYITNEPILFALGSAFIFIFVATLFCAYDFLIRREFNAKQRLLDIKRHLMMFVSQEVQRPLNAVCQGLSMLQDEMKDAVPAITHENNRMHYYHHNLLDDSNVALRTQYLQDDADHLRSHLEGWLHMTKMICDSAESSVDVLGDLLAYDDIIQTTDTEDDSSFALKLSVLNLWKLISDTSQEFLYSARSKNLQYSLENRLLDTDLEGEDDLEDPETRMESLKLVGDQKRLTQLLRNLLSNAIKVTSPNGRLTIRVSWEPMSDSETYDKHVLELGEEVSFNRRGTARLEVTDTGKGLAESQLQLLQDGAEVISADNFEAGKIKDIGLLISKRVALQHNGDLKASSSENGTTFTLELPLYHVPDNNSHAEDELRSLPPIPCPVDLAGMYGRQQQK